MAKETSSKIGTIRYTQKEKELIALAVESDFFKVLSKRIRPQRQIKIGMLLLNMASTPDDIAHYKGRSLELDWLINELERVAKEFNKEDSDTEE